MRTILLLSALVLVAPVVLAPGASATPGWCFGMKTIDAGVVTIYSRSCGPHVDERLCELTSGPVGVPCATLP